MLENTRDRKNGARILKYISASQIRTAHEVVLEKPLGQGEKADSVSGVSQLILFSPWALYVYFKINLSSKLLLSKCEMLYNNHIM